MHFDQEQNRKKKMFVQDYIRTLLTFQKGLAGEEAVTFWGDPGELEGRGQSLFVLPELC